MAKRQVKPYQQKTQVRTRNLLNDFKRTPKQILQVLRGTEDRGLFLAAKALEKRLKLGVTEEEQPIKTLILYIYNIMEERHDRSDSGTT